MREYHILYIFFKCYVSLRKKITLEIKSHFINILDGLIVSESNKFMDLSYALYIKYYVHSNLSIHETICKDIFRDYDI